MVPPGPAVASPLPLSLAPTVFRQLPASALPGPFPVGTYAVRLRERLRGFAHVQLVGEVCGLGVRRTRVYFELRDAEGALPCSMWRTDFDRLPFPVSDGMRVVAGGGCDLYTGSSTSSPAFSFSVSELRPAGEGDLLVALERLRRRLRAEGLFEPQKRLTRPALPRTIGVVTGEQGKARHDVLAALRRRGWAGRLVWAFAPVQDRHAAPRLAAALRGLAELEEVEVVIVARGGGSLADLFAFCDETLCRTVALLRVPVIASIGHHEDRTLLDDVAAVSCSTPTHAAEAAVPVDVTAARTALAAGSVALKAHASRAVLARARTLAHLSRAPRLHLERHRLRLHQLLRELRASGHRTLGGADALNLTHAHRLCGAAERLRASEARARARELERLRSALSGHDPERTLARGYALVEDASGTAVSSAAEARASGRVTLRFADGGARAEVER